MGRLTRLLRLWFTWQQPVTRRIYVVSGLCLMALKYGIDVLLMQLGAEQILGPLQYLHPFWVSRLEAMAGHAPWLPFLMACWALPFVWIGVSMTLRRAEHAGWPLWVGLLFFVPMINLLIIVALSLAPAGASLPQESKSHSPPVLRSSVLAVVGTALFGTAVVVISTWGAGNYGSALFLGAPFVMGLLASQLTHSNEYRGAAAGFGAAALGVTLCGGLLLIFALEGVLCLGMAAVIAFPVALLGAALGNALARQRRERKSAQALVLAVPLLAWGQLDGAGEVAERPVVTSIEIDAPPEQVWPHVVGFSELPPPSHWLLKIGIAAPLRARIVGSGVGAVRYCEFTTGAFVEPITHWEPPRRLAFDVIEQPPTMKEWSPYEIVHAPHLVGSLRSRRGEFLLQPLPGGRTRVSGTTWYTLSMAPEFYWQHWSDEVIHVIHRRVLRHIKKLSESASQR